MAGHVPNKPYVSADIKHHDYFAASIRGQQTGEGVFLASFTWWLNCVSQPKQLKTPFIRTSRKNIQRQLLVCLVRAVLGVKAAEMIRYNTSLFLLNKMKL